MTNSTMTSGKSAEAFRTISEVADALKLPQHVLRFWETRFVQIRPLKRGGGRRFYRPEDVELLGAIRQLLYGDGYTIKGVQRILKEHGPRAVAALAQGRMGRAALTLAVRTEPGMAVHSDADDSSPDINSDGAKAPDVALPIAQGSPELTLGRQGDRPELAFLRPEASDGRECATEPTAPGDPVAQLRSVLSNLAECRRILAAAGL